MLAPEPQQALFRDLRRETLDRDPAVVYAVDGQNRLIYVNTAWDAFGAANRGEHLLSPNLTSVCLLDVTPGALRPFYASLYDHVRTGRKPYEHAFECPSDGTYRELRMRVLPLDSSDGLLIMNSVIVERPHTISAVTFDAARYVDSAGLITMCSSCRRTRQATLAGWDWVPDLVERTPAELTYSLCSLCREYYYMQRRVLKARAC